MNPTPSEPATRAAELILGGFDLGMQQGLNRDEIAAIIDLETGIGEAVALIAGLLDCISEPRGKDARDAVNDALSFLDKQNTKP